MSFVVKNAISADRVLTPSTGLSATFSPLNGENGHHETTEHAATARFQMFATHLRASCRRIPADGAAGQQ